jgi:hypothetical protein
VTPDVLGHHCAGHLCYPFRDIHARFEPHGQLVIVKFILFIILFKNISSMFLFPNYLHEKVKLTW